MIRKLAAELFGTFWLVLGGCGAAVLAAARKVADRYGMIADTWNGFNVLHTAAARVGGLDLGFLPGEGGRDVEGILKGCEEGAIQAVFLLGADEIDMGRLGEPEEIARCVVFLAGDDAGFITGATLSANGGQYMT